MSNLCRIHATHTNSIVSGSGYIIPKCCSNCLSGPLGVVVWLICNQKSCVQHGFVRDPYSTWREKIVADFKDGGFGV